MKNPTTCHFFWVQTKIDHHPAGNEMPGVQGHRLPTRERLTMTVLIYVDAANKQVGDRDHLKVFASEIAAETWLQEHDPEGVAFEDEVLE
jgi:hypothetical protein